MTRATAEMQAEVVRLARRDGGVLKPALLVSYAEPEDSPLHEWFQWDDTEAARAWRVEQARQLIQVTVTTIERPQAEPVIVRAMVSLPRDRTEGGYRMLTDVLDDASMRAEMLADALAELNRVRARYATLRELAPVFAVLETVTQEHGGKRKTG